MYLSTSTSLFPDHRQGGRTPILAAIDLCYDAGFRYIDLSFCSAVNPRSGSELFGEDWEANIDAIGNHAAALGVKFTQAHTPYDSNLYRHDIKPLSEEYRAHDRESVRRAIIAAGKLGVKWIVNHAQTTPIADELSMDANIRANLDFFGWQVELAKQYGAGIAIENLAEFFPKETKHRFTATVEEQIAVIDEINDPACGAY